MKLSYSAIWADTIALLRAHASLVATIAGVFIFLPALLVAYMISEPNVSDPARLWREMLEYVSSNWYWFLLQSLVQMVGTMAILKLVFARGITVGGAIGAAAGLLPSYFLASLLSGILFGIGLLLLIVPGLYLFGRLAPLAPVIVAENRRNPVDAITRTFALTKGNGWALLGLIILVIIPALIIAAIVNGILGAIFLLVAGQDVGRLLALIVSSATTAAATILFILLYAAIYRALNPAGSVAAVFE